MASPQAENGHLDIAHEVLEKLLLARLTGTQWSLVMATLRKTWGWKKQEDYISLTQFRQLTGRHRNLIARELSVLQSRNILQQTKEPTFGRPAKWKFNKDWETWVLASRDTVTTEVTATAEGGGQSLPRCTGTVTAEVNLQKKKKRNSKKKAASPDADPRFHPLKEFFHTHYQKIRGTPLVTDGSDYKALTDLLKKIPNIPLKRLEDAALSYLNSDKEFDQKQGHPLRFWANNINPWLASAQDARRDHLNELN